ncbi:GAP family protein [Diaminobutyricibacter sp. McL0618]|uniref:GAP family protein n=1 Tax=Leifsonia sp. McL0618 TaxID=3415677 RepID=UPI003CEC2C59
MLQIIGLGFANAGTLAVQLLAIVLVILTRPRPKALLWAFWLTALLVSCAISSVVLALFRAHGTFLGSTSTSVSPVIYIIVGVIALAAALFAATKRGRELIGHEIDRRAEAKRNAPEHHSSIGDRAQVKVAAVKAKASDALDRGSVWVAIVAGVLMGAPSPFSLAAVGLMVRGGYTLPVQLAMILVFALVTYILVEIPVVSYLISPEGTAARVDAFAKWLGAHKIQAVAAVAAVVGVVFIVKGITAP